MVSLLAALVVAGVAFAGEAPRVIPACSAVQCRGKRIEDNSGLLQFCVPRGLRVRKEVGVHGDIHYMIKGQGELVELRVTSGLYFPGKLPEWAQGCEARQWKGGGFDGVDCTVTAAAGGARSRYITLNVPMSYAEYMNAPTRSATAFDRVLDSMCWKPHPRQ